jgi:type II secretory pathway predicted ATPase ExeA
LDLDVGCRGAEGPAASSCRHHRVRRSNQTNLYKVLYLHWTPGSTLELLRQLAQELDLEPAHYRGDLVRQISGAVVRLNQSKKQHPLLICDEAQLLGHPALEQLPLLLNSTWIRAAI